MCESGPTSPTLVLTSVPWNRSNDGFLKLTVFSPLGWMQNRIRSGDELASPVPPSGRPGGRVKRVEGDHQFSRVAPARTICFLGNLSPLVGPSVEFEGTREFKGLGRKLSKAECSTILLSSFFFFFWKRSWK